jgi:hypothetical protein
MMVGSRGAGYGVKPAGDAVGIPQGQGVRPKLLQCRFGVMVEAKEGVMAMENETKLVGDETTRPQVDATITPDWTESEWFEIWLKLARREYEKAKN